MSVRHFAPDEFERVLSPEEKMFIHCAPPRNTSVPTVLRPLLWLVTLVVSGVTYMRKLLPAHQTHHEDKQCSEFVIHNFVSEKDGQRCSIESVNAAHSSSGRRLVCEFFGTCTSDIKGYSTSCIMLACAGSLHEHLSTLSSIKNADLVAIAQQMYEALAFVHALGIYHRDIKLQNFLMTHANFVVLADFGHATVFGACDKELNRLVLQGARVSSPDDQSGTSAFRLPQTWTAKKLQLQKQPDPSCNDWFALFLSVLQLVIWLVSGRRSAFVATDADRVRLCGCVNEDQVLSFLTSKGVPEIITSRLTGHASPTDFARGATCKTAVEYLIQGLRDLCSNTQASSQSCSLVGNCTEFSLERSVVQPDPQVLIAV